jgi:hypothetical protein
MTCQPAFSAGQTPRHNNGDRDCYQSLSPSIEGASDTVPITKVMQSLNSMPPLVLTPAMQRDAFQMDHDRALRGNRAKAGRIAQEAREVTTALLRKGTCSGDAWKA